MVIIYLKNGGIMKKSYFYFICLIGLFAFVPNVQAKEVYFVNQNNVEFTKEEYDFISYMFWDGAQDQMSLNDYNDFVNSNIMNGELESQIYYDLPLTRSTSIEDANRTLKIVKSCSSNCFVSVTLTWKNSPTVRSYDVMGAYLSGTSLVNNPTTSITTNGTTTTYRDIKKDTNGFGVSMKLPTYGTSMVINQSFRVNKGGTVYASYQHAMKSISLANSKNYTLSRSGYGGVFKFSGTALTTYDRMNGVSISL